MPVLASRALLDVLSVGVGQQFPLVFNASRVDVTAVGTLDVFPTLYPADDWAVAPLDALLARLATAETGPTPPNELWLRVGHGAGALTGRARAAGLAPQGAVAAPDLEAAALADPLRLALDGTLAVGFVATLAVAALAFGIHFVTAARSRADEYAILRANGLSSVQVGRSLLLEQCALLLHGLLAGGVLGVAIAYAVLPGVQLGAGQTDVVPDTVVTPDPPSLAPAALALVGAGLLAGWLARRSAARSDIREQLRQLG